MISMYEYIVLFCSSEAIVRLVSDYFFSLNIFFSLPHHTHSYVHVCVCVHFDFLDNKNQIVSFFFFDVSNNNTTTTKIEIK